MPKIFLYDSLRRKKIIFKPLRKKMVTMYNCGPTVYDRSHIGNLRAYVFADILRRTLEFNNFKVKQIINITDVGHLISDADTGEDKVEKSAREKGKSVFEIARYFERLFKQDIKKLNIKLPFKFTRATDHIKEMIELIKILEKKGFTYKISDGIYFNTSKFKKYGELANLNKKKIKPGARVEFNFEKKNIYDFALWKFSPLEVKRQMEWRSPWGKGFPGWHIECSAMAMKYLGKTLDIHTGGIDHIDVHHTNEIAQSEAATNKKFVNYWLHVNFLLVENQKMSKSLGNILSLDDILKKNFSPLAFRYLLLTAHYRSLINFTWSAITAAQNAYNNLLEQISSFNYVLSDEKPSQILKIRKIIRTKILSIINDDLNTSQLISFLWDILRSENKQNFTFKKIFVLEADKILGLGLTEFLVKEKINKRIIKYITLREKLRKKKQWQKADNIREKLLKMGYKIEDSLSGPVIKKVIKN